MKQFVKVYIYQIPTILNIAKTAILNSNFEKRWVLFTILIYIYILFT